MNELKVILLCSNRFALPAMQQLYFFNQLKAVVIPAHCEEMIAQTQHLLQETGIPVLIVTKENFVSQLENAIHEYQVNLGLIMTFSYILPAVVYSLPEKGFYNVHPGLLPVYRGADPVFHQIKNKEKFAGITIHLLDDGIDTGAIVIKEKILLSVTDTHGMLITKLSRLAAIQVGILMKLISLGVVIHAKKQEEAGACYFGKQTERDVRIDWEEMDAPSIIALINACNPWNKGAVTKINNQILRILVAEILPANSCQNQQPGYVVALDETGLIVSASNASAILVRMIYADEGFMQAAHAGKLGIVPGNCFES